MDKVNPYAFPGLPKTPPPKRVIEKVLPIMFERYGITKEEFLSKSKKDVTVYIRQLLAYWLKRKYKSGISLNVIAGLVGVSHHTTIIKSIARFEGYMTTKSELPTSIKHLATDIRTDYRIVDTLIRKKCL